MLPVLAALSLANCGPSAREIESEAKPPPAGLSADAPMAPEAASWEFPVAGSSDQPDHSVRIEAAPDAVKGRTEIRRLVIRAEGHEEPIQSVEDLAAEPPKDLLDSGNAWQALDMNFDGYTDFRIVALAPAGPNVRFLHWLYDPVTRRFEASAALDALSSTSFDPELSQVSSSEREDPTRYVTETFEFSNDRLSLVRRSVKTYLQPGRYRLVVSEPRDGRLRVTEERTVDE